MRYRFDRHELDVTRGELRSDGAAVPLEPRVYALLCLLVEQRERLISREELIEKIWDGRIVSDAAIATCVKSERRALGDDGRTQRYLRTVHGRGLRFVAPVTSGVDARDADAQGDADALQEAARAGRPSIAVLPFTSLGAQASHAAPYAVLAEALPQELIAALACLRWLFVIARGSSFRFRDRDPDIPAIGRALRVRYILSGTVEIEARGVRVTSELADTRDGGLLWSEGFSATLDALPALRERLVTRIVNALEFRIPLHEARQARLVDPANVDAWASYHLGLQHAWRFNRHDNALAAACFAQALQRDPQFARAHAGLSFTSFQDAFLRYSSDTAAAALAAREAAERAVALDAADPFANFTLGRSLWLAGDLDGSLVWLERATMLAPSYAQGHYARGWAQTLAGEPTAGRASADLALALSPLDPLAYAMLGTRALSLVALGDYAEAARHAERAARSPGAHPLIAMIAALCHALADDAPRAAHWARVVRERRPDLSGEDFLRAFPFATPALRRRIAATLRGLGW
ncbi:MAG TPA: winged helix-turn-helix domain-containing protein [Gammaproteobacteria bacterium]|nr:winged helix-turn-helix domain-containing protein [Gammaproteobacteria bacterium]